MDEASIAVAHMLRNAIEAGCLPEGTVLRLSKRAPHLTYEQRLAVINGLRRMGYANEAIPPEVRLPPELKYVDRLKREVLPRPEIELSVPLLAKVLGRDELPEAMQLQVIRRALLILKDAGLVYIKSRKFFRS